jgi:predicted PurR-regulated permease PerM
MSTNPADDRRYDQLIDLTIRIAILGFLVYWVFVLLRPFLAIALWSIVLAVALYPVFEWLTKCLGGRPRPAALLLTAVGLLVTIGPVTWLGLGLIENGRVLYAGIASGELTLPAPRESVKEWPLVGEQVYALWALAAGNLKAALIKVVPELKPFGAALLGAAGSVGLSALGFTASVLVAGFLLGPAPSLVSAIRAFARKISPGIGEQFVILAGATIRNVARGVIGIAVIQTLLAGIGLVVAGVPGASILTFAVLVLAIVQVGAAIILLPLIIWSWFAMDATSAFLFTAYMIPVNVIDNVLRPLFLGRGMGTPMLVILVGVLGGTLAHGMIGLFIGPIVLAVSWELLTAWLAERRAADGDANGSS